MPDIEVSFRSDGLALAGVIGLPEHLQPSERRAAFIVMHGFGTNMHCRTEVDVACMLQKLGYVTLRFDMRGCGKSEGERGRIICLEDDSDASSALTFLQSHPNVVPKRLGMFGSSF